MGKSFTRDPNNENFRGDMRNTRKANKQNRDNRHKRRDVLDHNMERDDADYGKHSDDFRPRRDDW